MYYLSFSYIIISEIYNIIKEKITSMIKFESWFPVPHNKKAIKIITL